MNTGTQEIVWLPPGSTIVTVPRPLNPETILRHAKPQPDPEKTWTLNGLLRSPAPALPTPRSIPSVTVQLEQVGGGSWMMAAHEGVLYLSEWIPGRPPTPADFARAQQLGYTGFSSTLLLSWQVSSG
jgi:hypothetical protein